MGSKKPDPEIKENQAQEMSCLDQQFMFKAQALSANLEMKLINCVTILPCFINSLRKPEYSCNYRVKTESLTLICTCQDPNKNGLSWPNPFVLQDKPVSTSLKYKGETIFGEEPVKEKEH